MKHTKVTIRKKIEAKSLQLTLDELRENFGKIYSDELLLQRLLNIWDDVIATDHMIAFLEGHSNIYSLVLINVVTALDDAKNKLRDFTKEDTQYANIEDTIEYLERIKENGFMLLCVDGQHRINCYESNFQTGMAMDFIERNNRSEKPWTLFLSNIMPSG